MDRARVQRALDAISAIFSDTSVPPEQTLEQMEEIRSDVEAKCQVLEEDIKRREK